MEVRIFWARYLGVNVSGPAKRDPALAREATGSPHSRQNFAPLGSSLWHLAQRSVRRAPHSRQNLAFDGLSCWQRGQFMRAVSSSRGVLNSPLMNLLTHRLSVEDASWWTVRPRISYARLPQRNGQLPKSYPISKPILTVVEAER